MHLPQSPGKVLLSKFTVVHIVLLCDQSICVTKTLWKDARCSWYWVSLLWELKFSTICLLRLLSFHLWSGMKTRLQSSCVSVQWESCLQNSPEAYEKEMPRLYDFQTFLRIRKIFKRDLNLSLNAFPHPLLHQSNGLQYQCTVSIPRQSCSLG